MKINIYAVMDNLATKTVAILTAQSDDVLKRQIRGALVSKGPNPINTDTKDKYVYQIASFNDETLEVFPDKRFAFSVEEIRQGLVASICGELEPLKKAIADLEEVKKDVSRE